jgi:protein-tyrosine-phosphatase
MELVFVCTYNSGRSQMAEAFARLAGGQELEVSSAGITPGREVNPKTRAVMRELGFDLSGQQPKGLALSQNRDSNYLVVMGTDVALETGGERIEPQEIWGIPNPQGKPLEEIREIRNLIQNQVEELLERIYSKIKKAA